MALNAGEVYFSAMLQLEQANRQAEEFRRKQRDLVFNATLNTSNLNNQINKVTSKAANIQSKLNIDTKGFRNQMGTLSVFAGTTLSNALSKATDTAAQAVGAILKSGAGFATDSVKSYTEISGILTQVQAKAGATDAAMAGLRGTIVKTAGETAANVVQMTKLSEVMVQAGRSISDINNALPGLARGSAATGRAADKLAGDLILYLDSYQLASGQTEAVLNRLVGTTLAANVNANQLAQSMKFFRSAADGLKGVENQLKVTALAASAGLSGGQAGRNSAALFAAAIKRADEVAKEFNVSVKDNAGNLRSEVEVLLELRAEFNKIAESQGDAVARQKANALFGVQGSRILTGVAKLSEETITNVLTKINEASLESSSVLNDLASAAQKGLAGAALAIQNSIGTIQFQLGDALSKSVAAVGFALSGIFQEIAKNTVYFDFLRDSGESFANALSDPAVVQVLKQVAVLVSETIGQGMLQLSIYLDNVTQKIKENPQVIADIASTILNVVTALIQITATIAEIAIKTGALLANTIDFDSLIQIIRASFDVLLGVVASFFQGFTSGLQTSKTDTEGLLVLIRGVGTILTPIAGVIGQITGLVASLALKVTELFSSFGGGETTGGAFSSIIDQITDFQDKISSFFTQNEILSQAGQAFNQFFEGVSTGIQGLIDSFVTSLEPSISPFLDKVQGALPGISALVQKIGEWIINSLPTFQSLMNLVGTILGNATGLLLNITGNLIQVAGWLAQVIADNQILDGVIKGLQSTLAFIFDRLADVSTVMSTIQGKIYDFIIPAVGSILTGIGNIGNLLSGAILLPFQGIYDLIFGTKTLADNFLVNTIAGFAQKIGEIDQLLNDKVNQFVASVQAKWNEVTSSISGWFTNNLLPIFTSVIPNALSSFWASELEKWEETKSRITEGFNNFISFFTTSIPEAFTSLINSIDERINATKTIVSTFFNENVISFFTSTIPDSFNSLMQRIGDSLLQLGETLRAWFQDNVINFFAVQIPDAYNSFIVGVQAKIAEVQARVADAFSFVTNWLGSTIVDTINIFASFVRDRIQQIYDFYYGLYEQVSAIITETLPNLIRTLGQFIKDRLQQIYDFYYGLYEQVRLVITETLPNLIRTLGQLIRDRLQDIYDFYFGLYENVRTAITVTLPELVAALKQNIQNRIEEIWNRTKSFFEDIRVFFQETLVGYLLAAKDKAITEVQKVIDKAESFFEEIRIFAQETLPGYLVALKDRAILEIQKIIDKIEGFFENVRIFIQETVPGYVTTFFANVGTEVTNLSTSITDKIKKPIEDVGKVFTNITDASKSIADNISGWGQNVQNFIGDFGQNAWNSLLGAFGGGTPGQGNSSDLLAFLGGDLTAQEFLTRNSFGSSGGQQEALRLAQKYYSDPVTGSNENIFKQAGFSDALLRIVKSAEGFYENAYFDPNLYGGRGGYSIGFGTYARNSTERIGVEEGNRRLLDELESARKQVLERADRYGYKLSSSQVDAMISFVYNGGIGMFDQLSNYGKRSLDEISGKIPLYNKSGSRELLGLTRRREIEKTLFDGTTVNTILNQVGNGLYDSYLTGLIPGQKYGASRSGGLRRHAGTDFDIQDRGGTFESFIGGRVVRTGYDAGGYYRWFDIQNDALGMIERIAELDNVYVKKGDIVQPGQVVGNSSTDTGVVHVEYRPIGGYSQNPFGFSGTIDPIQYLTQTLGLFNLSGTRFTPVGGTATSFSGDRGQLGGASDTLARLGGDLVMVTDNQMQASERINSFAQQITDALYSTSATTGTTTTSITPSTIDSSSPATQIAEALIGGEPTSTSADNIFAQLLAIAQRIESDLRIITQFFETLNAFTENIEDFVANIRNTVRSKIRIGLSPNDQENFSLINTLQQTYRTGRDQLRELTRSDSGEQSGLGRLVGLLTGQNTDEGAFSFGLPGAVSNLAESARNIYRTVADNYQSATDKIDLGKIGDVYDMLMRGQAEVKVDLSQFDLQDLTSPTFQQQNNSQALEQLSGQMVSYLLGVENTRLSAEADLIKQFAEQSGISTQGLDFRSSGVEMILEEIAQQSGRDFNEILNDLKKKVGDAELTSSQTTQQLTDSEQQIVKAVELQAKLAEALLSEDYQAILEARKALLVDEQSRSKLFEDSLMNSLSQLSLAETGVINTPQSEISQAIQDAFTNYLKSQTVDLSQGAAVNQALKYFTNTANSISQPSSVPASSRSNNSVGAGGSVTFKIQYEPVQGTDKGYVTTGQLDELVNYLNNEFSIDLSNQTLEKLRRNPSLRTYILDA